MKGLISAERMIAAGVPTWLLRFRGSPLQASYVMHAWILHNRRPGARLVRRYLRRQRRRDATNARALFNSWLGA